MTRQQVCTDCGSVSIVETRRRRQLRNALMDLSLPRHKRPATWARKPIRFRKRAMHRVRPSQTHVKRHTYRPTRPTRGSKRPNVAAEALISIGVVVTVAVVLRALPHFTLNF